jgi:UDP-glucuronate 4-epimerase
MVTGAAGFIGYHVADRLLRDGAEVVGVDSLNDYYDVSLKEARLARLAPHPRFRFIKLDVSDQAGVAAAFEAHRPNRVVHLAAQAGVRYSLVNPHVYISSNVTGFLHVLECCRHNRVEHLVYASSSSVYGANTQLPFSVHQNVDHPVSLYAASKKANELMAHSYSHLFGLPTTGLRFFTVYGPWSRPDMALFLFTRSILSGEPIDLYNNGDMQRDFTYIDDIVEGVIRTLDRVPAPDAGWSSDRPDPASSRAPYRIYNIGNHQTVALKDFVALLEDKLGRKAAKNYLPLQPGDVLSTYADVDDLTRDTGFQPSTPIEVGIGNFVDWYRSYYS